MESLEGTKPAFHAVRRALTARFLWFHLAQSSGAGHLNENWFMSLQEARMKIEAWRRDYNQVRPHSALGYQTPEEFAARAAARGASPPTLAAICKTEETDSVGSTRFLSARARTSGTGHSARQRTISHATLDNLSAYLGFKLKISLRHQHPPSSLLKDVI